MTLFIAFLLIIGLKLSKLWIIPAAIVWVAHLWYHDTSGLATGINRIYQKQHSTKLTVEDIKREILK
jgi:hypothetical protein